MEVKAEVSEEANASNPPSEFPEYEIKLYEENGNLVKTTCSAKKNQITRLDVRDVKPGHYFLHIEAKGETIKEHVFIER